MDGISATLHSLVSALGGRDPTEPGNPYVLGDDGLGCLRDIKRWLQHYDEKKDVWDVKSALASINVVSTDLCPILETWPTAQEESEHRRRICLACGKTIPHLLRSSLIKIVEILVPITWPLDLGPDADEFKIKQYPNLKLAQSGYKRSILFNPERDVLTTILRVAYPSLALPRRQRSERDSGIIRLVVYLLRNLVAIDEGRDRSETILALQKAKALEFLCVLASGMGEEFLEEDVIVLDTIYFLLRGVDPSTIFDPINAASDTIKKDLSNLLAKEKHMRTDNKKLAHTRHNRFGTMISVVKDSRRFTVASQTAIIGNNFAGIEASKKWNRPQTHIKTHEDVEIRISLNTEARLAANIFVSMFLDAGFNPLLISLLKALEHDDSRVSQSNRLQFLYIQAWSFKALREKGKANQKKHKLSSDFSDDADYQIIASMMESRATIMLRKMLREAIESKLWKETHAAMDCLKELLLTIHSMSMSSNLEYQDIAENLQSNLYYEESNLDLVATCVRTYTNQSLGYLKACTDLSTVLLKMLERFASSKTHMFVRARRQRQKAKHSTSAETTTSVTDRDDDEEAEVNAREAVKERAFSFAKFERKFMNDHSVDTFLSLLEYYADLSADEIRRVIQFFHRAFVKVKVELLLFRLDLFELLNRMVKDKAGLPATSPARPEVENFTVYLVKRFARTLETSPALAWEILFEKLSNDPYYLDHDSNKAPIERKSPRAPAEFEVRPGASHEDQIKIVVGVLLDDDQSAFLNWFKSALAEIVARRLSWESREQALQTEQEDLSNPGQTSDTLVPPDEDLKLLLFKDGKVRLLLKVLSLQRLGNREDPEAIWIVPANLDTVDLNNDLHLIKEYSHNAPEFEEGKLAKDFIRRQIPKKDSYNTDSSDSPGTSSDESDKHVSRKKRQLSTGRPKAIKEVDYKQIEARRLKREAMEEQRTGQIKSAKYVNDSDDEDDEAANAIFFAAEAALRERQKLKALGPNKPASTLRKSGLLSKMKNIDRDSPSQASSNKENEAARTSIDSSEDEQDSASSPTKDTTASTDTEQELGEPGIQKANDNNKRIRSGASKNDKTPLFVPDESDSDLEITSDKRMKTVTGKRSARQMIYSDGEE